MRLPRFTSTLAAENAAITGIAAPTGAPARVPPALAAFFVYRIGLGIGRAFLLGWLIRIHFQPPPIDD
jgi:hypothetical protein